MPDRYLRKPDDEYDEIQLSVAETAYYKKSPLTTRVRMAKQYGEPAEQISIAIVSNPRLMEMR